MCAVVVDFEKAIDSLHRESLWKILRHNGIPQTLVHIIQSLYKNFECWMICNNQLTQPFAVNTKVNQGSILSHFDHCDFKGLFSLAVDWIMRNITEGKKQGLQGH